MASTSEQQHFYDLIKNFSTAMMTTKTSDGSLHTRPMRIAQVEEGSCLWFLTSTDCPKVQELTKDCCVNISMMSESGQYLSCNGKACLMKDKNKLDQLWSEAWRIWFPEGKDTPNLGLIKVEPTSGEYWDFSGVVKTLQYAFEAGKAWLTGEKMHPEKVGETGKVDLQKTATA